MVYEDHGDFYDAIKKKFKLKGKINIRILN
jgi:hypothetical protein